jgi:hypothetical protein
MLIEFTDRDLLLLIELLEDRLQLAYHASDDKELIYWIESLIHSLRENLQDND